MKALFKRIGTRPLLCLCCAMIGLAPRGRAADPAPNARTEPEVEPKKDLISQMSDSGITFPFNYTGEVLGNATGGSSRGAIYEGLLKAGIQIDLAKLASWTGASLVVNGLYAHGPSLTDLHVHDFNRLSNIDAYDSPRLYEVWFQQDFLGGEVSVRAGQILADAEFFLSDNSALFINSAFGVLPPISMNLTPPVFPVAAPGIRIRLAPSPAWYVQTAAFSGYAGNPATDDKYGTRFSFPAQEGVLVFAEAGYKLHPKDAGAGPPASAAADAKDKSKEAPAPAALAGTYKIGGFYDSADFDNDSGNGFHHGDWGVYGIVDQDVWHPGGNGDIGLSVFGRASGAPSDRNTVVAYFDTGFNYKGLLPSREKDLFGIGFSYTRLSGDLLDAAGAPVASHYESILEVTYDAAFGDHLSVQPDFQCIFNPGATEPASPAIILGMRFAVTF